MKTFITKTFLIPFLMLFVLASCSKEEIVRPQAEPGAEYVVKGGQEEEFEIVDTKVTNSASLPVANATIKFKQSGQTIYFGTTDSAGECQFGAVCHGTYDYEIVCSGYETLNDVLVISAPTNRQDELVEL